MIAGTSSPPSQTARPPGRVYLVGAGPGDPELLTRRAAKLLRRADVVVHDALVGERILELLRPGVRRVDVGKRAGGRRTPQHRINEILVEAARDHRIVVRLKGGDPFVFGRGGEEALALRDAGIAFEVVPGVTAATGVSAYAGIPLTHRQLASSVTFVTGHEDAERRTGRVDWEALARLHGTIAIYMGTMGLASIAAKLIAGGRSPDTPAAAVEWGTHARQRTVEAPLGEIAAAVQDAGIGTPALVVIGEVTKLRREIGWFDRLPLRGARVVVARSRPQTSRLTRALAALGAETIDFPRLRAVPVEAASDAPHLVESLARHEWLLFTSPAGVDHFWRGLGAAGLDARALGNVKVVSLGLPTTRALRRRGIRPDRPARTYEPAAVLALFGPGHPRDLRVLFPGDDADASPITEALRRAGALVDRLTVYRTELVEPGVPLDDPRPPDAVVLPSSGAVRLLADSGLEATSARFIAIGPRTAETALACGFPVHAIAGDHTVPGTVRTVVEQIGPPRAVRAARADAGEIPCTVV